ncbi:MAG: glycosyltransferase [Methyloversatilis sp.]|uniref:glycosyltransferase n=1 Tax=Methyloversatilis sp. TaxID=2569862 RepID=UPI00273532FE|nr:glycosyltransferase [Methyloversatilis sp.]MDP2867928.1 glycosyltransferase [Methyloversatilis sp.]
MKIEVVSFTGDSGLADYAVSLARSLSAHANVSVVTARSLDTRFDAMGFAVERVFRRSRHYPIDIFRFIAGVIRRRPDWLIVQGPLKFPLLDALVIRLLRACGVSAAVTVHDVLPHYPRPWSRLEYGCYFRSFSRVIVHSAAAREGLRELGVLTTPLIVPHGVYDIFDLTAMDLSVARKHIGDLSDDDMVVLFFGHLEPRKGLMAFLDAAESMSADASVKFLVAGGSTLASHGERYARRLEAARGAPNLIVHDRRIPFEEVERYFAASNIVALPYLEGTTSGVLKLALAFGKPVVATRVGDFPEQIPAGAGELIESDASIAGSLVAAIQKIREKYSDYAKAMGTARGAAEWADIAASIYNYLRK